MQPVLGAQREWEATLAGDDIGGLFDAFHPCVLVIGDKNEIVGDGHRCDEQIGLIDAEFGACHLVDQVFRPTFLVEMRLVAFRVGMSAPDFGPDSRPAWTWKYSGSRQMEPATRRHDG